jgi:hypothetical protein
MAITPLTCPMCGAPLAVSARACHFCGARLRVGDPAARGSHQRPPRRVGYGGLGALLSVLVVVALILLVRTRGDRPLIPATLALVAPTPLPTATPRPASTSPPPPRSAQGVAKVDLPTNDLVYDPGTKRIYASVPGRAGAQGNSLVVIDPVTATIAPGVPIGSEPSRLALSDDGKYLYVGLDGAGAVRRFNLARQQPDLQIALGSDPRFGPYFAADIAVVPGHSDTIAVARRYGSDAGRAPAGVALYADGIKLPHEAAASFRIGIIVSCDSPTILYSYNNYDSGAEFYRLAVDGSGVSVMDTTPGLIPNGGYGQHLRCDGGRLYAHSGQVIDPSTRTVVGTYPAVPFNSLVRPDSAAGRTFFLTPTAVSSTSSYKLLVFDQRTLTPIASVDVPELIGEDQHPATGGARSLVRWGAAGLAFRSTTQIVLMQSPLDGGHSLPAELTATAAAMQHPSCHST